MNIKMNYVGIATFTLTIDDKFKIGVDPALNTKEEAKKRLVDPVYNEETFNDIDLWLITHPHWDHLDEKGISVIKEGVPVYGPNNLKDIASKNNFNFTQLDWGVPKSIEFEDYNIIVQAMPAFHGKGLVGKIMGNGNGYAIMILKGDEEHNIYITGDTIVTDELIERFNNCRGANLFIPFLGAATYLKNRITLNVKEGREVAKFVHAENTIAVHIDDCSHYHSDRDEVKKYFNAPLPGDLIELDI